jgi:hypothetical protein
VVALAGHNNKFNVVSNRSETEANLASQFSDNLFHFDSILEASFAFSACMAVMNAASMLCS